MMKFFTAFFLALIALGFAGRCDFTCPVSYNPVCGSDGKTYFNPCALRQAACRSNSISTVSIGECPISHTELCESVTCPEEQICVPSPKQCIRAPCPQYQCVDNAEAACGNVGCPNNRVCVFEPKQCIRAPCPQYGCIRKPSCPRFCPMLYNPVCGSDGVTYSNECMLRQAVCEALPRQLTVASDGECPRIGCPLYKCAPIYQPICGTDGVTYDNSCVFDQAICNSGYTLSKFLDGTCPSECPLFKCPAVYEPICGSDGKTYDNGCIFNQAICQSGFTLFKFLDSACPAGCPKMKCTADYQPVCGSDGVTYDNMCVFKQAVCSSGFTLTKAYNGECSVCHDVTCPEGQSCIPDPKFCKTLPCPQHKCQVDQ